MTTTYDPHHPSYLDEADVRDELTRVFDVCHGCRKCVDLCGSFPTLFEMIDQHEDSEAGNLTPAQQDRVVDECHHCKLCHVRCPYAPGLHPLEVDVPRLVLRATAMRAEHGHTSGRSKVATQVLGRTDLVGRVATTFPGVANRIVQSEPDSFLRRVGAKVTGVSAVRVLAPYAKQRFSTWFAKRPKIRLGSKQGSVTVFPTCLVEYHATGVGKDLVRVYERNGIECSVSGAGCCGAPWLHSGDVERFTEIAEKNVARLADEVRSGTDVVVPQPTCTYVLKRDYPDYVGETARDDAALVAEHTFDAAEYLMKVHTGDDTVLDIEFGGETPRTITYHAPCHLRAQGIGLRSRDLLKLTGAKVRLVQQCAGMDGTWGARAENDERSIPIAVRLGERIAPQPGEVVAGDCQRANGAIAEQTGAVVQHPLQIIARAYGLPRD